MLPQQLLPDNVVPRPMSLLEAGGIVIGVLNPTPSVSVMSTSACIGSMPNTEDWHLPRTAPPDGTFALFRGDATCIELVTDTVASRTVWYFLDDSRFIASTSQRAILSLVGGFQFDSGVIPWMLSTGTLGPLGGWDRRLRRLGGDASVTLDRKSWTLVTKSSDVSFSPAPGSDDEHERGLRETLEDAVAPLRFDGSEWALPLSGGYDSRSLLCLLGRAHDLRTVTWGLKASVEQPANDAYIARQLAAHYRLRHDFFPTDISSAESVETVFDRYLLCGDGRVDNISGYADGLNLWASMYKSGIRGIIRGDEGFGWIPVYDPADVRIAVGVPLWSDFANLEPLEHFDLPRHAMPDELTQRATESLDAWRDRLYHQYRIPVVIAALNDVKAPYVEIVNPLLHRRIVHRVRQLPDRLRTGKKVFKAIVQSLTPPIAFAEDSATISPKTLLKTEAVVDCIRQELTSDSMTAILPATLVKYVMERMISTGSEHSLRKPRRVRRLVKSYVPAALMRLRKRHVKPKMDFNVLAFRLYLISRMNRMLCGVR